MKIPRGIPFPVLVVLLTSLGVLIAVLIGGGPALGGVAVLLIVGAIIWGGGYKAGAAFQKWLQRHLR